MAKFLPDDLAVDRLLLQLNMAAYSWQEQLFKSRASMVLLNCSRKAGKSTCVEFLALLEALTIQQHLVLVVSRSARQSRLLLSKVRDFMARMPLKAVQRARASAEQIVFPNLSQIVALPCKEETIRGYSSVGLLIIDEAARVPDELYHAVRPMLAASDGRLICLSTPYGRVGFFHDAWTSDTQAWERISVRAADVPHIKPEFLAREREIMLPATYAQESTASSPFSKGSCTPISSPRPNGRLGLRSAWGAGLWAAWTSGFVIPSRRCGAATIPCPASWRSSGNATSVAYRSRST